MNKIFNYIIAATVTASALTACGTQTLDKEDDLLTTGGKGQLSLKSLSVTASDEENVVETKATDGTASSTVNTDNFTVSITNKTTGVKAYEWVYSEMPEVATLPEATYSIEACSDAPAEVAWESPYYYAKKDVAVKNNEVSDPGTIVCKLANTKVSIRYSEALKTLIGSATDVKVNVSVGNRSLDYAYSETRAGYFKYYADSTTLVATFSGTVGGEYISEYKTITNINAGEHRIITFDVKDVPDPESRTGYISTAGLVLSAEVKVVDLARNINVKEDVITTGDMLEVSPTSLNLIADGTAKRFTVNATSDWTYSSTATWLKVSPAGTAAGSQVVTVSADANTSSEARTATITVRMGELTKDITVTQAGSTAKKPTTITSSTLDLDGRNKVTSGMKAIVDINCPEKIANLKVNIVSGTLTPAVLASVNLASSFDLAYPGTLEKNLQDLGFPTGNDVIGKEYLQFDITSFMTLLKNFKGDHNFELEVTDQAGQVTTAVIRLYVE